MLAERNRALGNFSGWLSDDPTLFQARESVRSRSLAPSWFTDSLQRMSRDLWRAGLQRRHWSLRIGGLRAHYDRRLRVQPADGGFAAWSRRLTATVSTDVVACDLRSPSSMLLA